MSKNQSGFAVIETVLVVILLAIIGGTSWYLHNASNKASATLTSVTGDQTVVAPKTKHALTATQAEASVQTLYAKYLITATNNQSVSARLASVKSSLAPGLYQSLSQAYQKQSGTSTDLLLCSPTVPASIAARVISSTTGTANVQVTETFAKTTQTVNVTVALPVGFIGNITCPTK